MNEYEPLTDPTLVTQKLRVAVQKPDGITDQVLSESVLDIIASRGGESEIDLNPAPQVLLTLGYMGPIGSILYKSAWLNIKPSEGKYEGYEVIDNEGAPQLYASDFEARTQTAVSSTNTALRLRLLQLLLDGHINTPTSFKIPPL